MIGRLGVRARLTILVTLVFAVAASAGAAMLVASVRQRLIDDTRASAEAVLGDYLGSLYGGVPTLAMVDDSEATSFFWRDDAGNDISERSALDEILLVRQVGATAGPRFVIGRSFDYLSAGVPAEPAAGAGTASQAGGSADSGIGASVVSPGEAAGSPGVVTAADPETGQLLTAGGAVVKVDYQPLAVGPVRAVERGDHVVAVSQRLALPDGSHLEVGVSSPLRPVTDSLDTMRTMLWIAVPALVAAVGVITWFAAQRALQPVHTITQRARAITATNLSERVPVPASSDDVNELATTMNEMLARLDHAQQRQRQFIADASHELRSPVAASCAQLEVALAHPDSVDWAATAATVLTEQAHLGRLIEDLLALSRLDEQGAGTLGDVDLDELVAAEAARHHSIPVRAEVAEPVRIRGNATLIARAVRNLVDNAGRHATTAVTVTVTVRQPDPALAVIHVDDDGPGVAAEQRIRIFDRFTRLDDARRRDDGGTGLGLAIAREVTRAHGGQISCEEAPGGGARFTLWFPTGGPP